MSVQDAVKRLESMSSSSSSLSGTTAATTPEPSQSRRESYDVNAAANATVDAAKVSSKLTTLAGAAAPFIVPGSDEGYPIDPLLRTFDPSKDANLSIEELLARPRLPTSPFERLAMAKLKLAASGAAAANELSAEEQAALKKVNREKKAALRKADRDEHVQRLRAMANDFAKKK